MVAMEKEFIKKSVNDLLASAKKRGTNQGVLVYTSVLRMLEEVTSQSQVDEIKAILNKALSGIEAHGDLTKEEYTVVQKLREWTA
ncbi:MAG: hypothetical protein AB7E95_03715 [Kiritimatiellales bacterium]